MKRHGPASAPGPARRTARRAQRPPRAAGAGAAMLLVLVGALASLAGPACGADPSLPYGINVHVPSSAVLDLVRDAGIAWIRVDFDWYLMEPERGVRDFARTDAVVSEARARGLSIFATLAYTPAWANGGQGINVPATDSADWYRFVHDVVARYRDDVTHWGMWNEPNLEQFFAGTVEAYVQDVLRVGARAVRDADPAAFVLGPDLAQLRSAQWPRWLYTVLREAGDAIDIVTHHDYQEHALGVLWDLGARGPLPRGRTPRGIMELTGAAGKPLWLTETGWRTDQVSEDQQAAYYVQVLRAVDSLGWFDKVFFYEIADDPRFPEEWGILRSDLTPKIAYDRYRDYISTHPRSGARALEEPSR